ncbi:MAG: RNA polymerase subunit sigma-70 [Propionibacteriaceae bacterium]|nr:MAG: RNA polymerase subunit sigma-70 [Propionibacteriaceae bacterium]
MAAAPRPETASGYRVGGTDGSRFDPSMLYAVAKLYYLEDATQAEVAAQLGTSRATVSRLLSEARRQGIVKIQVIAPEESGADDLAANLATALGLTSVELSAPFPPTGPGAADVLGSVLAPAVGRALDSVGLSPGDVLLVSSGRTVYEVARYELPRLPGVVVAPTVGGTDQPEAWYQTNEITRLVAERIGGRAMYLFAPALPGPELYETLQHDPTIQRVLHLWPHARCVLTGIGAPPLLRAQAPQFIDTSSAGLVEAIGDICSRFFSRSGAPVTFPGSERLIALDLETLKQVPVVIAVAAGADKVAPLIAAARAGFFDHLVTDPQTARLVLDRM